MLISHLPVSYTHLDVYKRQGIYVYVGNPTQICLHCRIEAFNLRITAIGIILHRTYRHKISLRSSVSPFGSFGINIADVVINMIQVINTCLLYTSCFALGLEDGMKLAESLDDVQAFFVTSDYEIHYTRDFQKKIKVTETG